MNKNCDTNVIILYNEIEFLQTPYQHLKGISPETINRITLQSFIERSNIIHNYKFDYSLVKFNSIKDNVDIVYNNKIYNQPLLNHLYGKEPKGLDTFKKSKGSKKIANFLESNNIHYFIEYKFKECRNILPLPFDFYLPDYNICIEYDGKQHFEIIKHYGGEVEFELTKKRDGIKNIFCINNNIRLLRIPYYNLKNIEKILEEQLFNSSSSI